MSVKVNVMGGQQGSSNNKKVVGTDFMQNSGYADLYAANPYSESSYGDLGLWDRICNVFGWRSGEDRYNADRELMAKQYDAQIASLQFENEYNSPEAQAERMREAGMNPDLVGTSGVAGAAEMTENFGLPDQGDNGAQFIQSVQMLGSCVEKALSMYSLGLDLQGKALANAGAELDVNRGIDEYALKRYLENYSDPIEINPDLPIEKQIDTALHVEPVKFFKSNRLNKKFNNRLQFFRDHPTLFTEGEIAGMKEKLYGSTVRSGEFVSTPGFFEGIQGIGEALAPLRDITLKNDINYQKKVRPNEMASQNSKSKYDSEYYDKMDPEKAASAINNQNENETSLNDIKATVNKAFNKCIDNLQKLADDPKAKGHDLANCVLLLISLSMNGALSKVF